MSTPSTKHAITAVLMVIAISIGAPLVGVVAANRAIWPYLQFPPRTLPVEPPAYSWLVFILMALGIVAATVIFYVPRVSRRLLPDNNTPPAVNKPRAGKATNLHIPIPYWGWLGSGLLAASWIAAWTNPLWIGAAAQHTFAPLWLGFVLTVDGLVYARTNDSMLSRSPRAFLLLLLISAAGWWFFEYLNRFTQNWYYTAVHRHDALEYILSATPPFATVLPAVFAVTELIRSFDWIHRTYRSVAKVPFMFKGLRPLSIAIGGLGLAAAAYQPEYFFPALWIAPLFIIYPVLSWLRVRTPLTDLVNGDWRGAVALSLAALCCGFFWEMWNFYSSPKWHYSIPFVERFHLFEMPILGYAGYLPFGLVCYGLYALATCAIRWRKLQFLNPLYAPSVQKRENR